MMDNKATIRVELYIPEQKLLAQAMEISEGYKPIVLKALEEARENLLFDENYKRRVKDLLRIKIEEILKKAIEDSVSQVVDKKYWDIQKEVIKIMSEDQ